MNHCAASEVTQLDAGLTRRSAPTPLHFDLRINPSFFLTYPLHAVQCRTLCYRYANTMRVANHYPQVAINGLRGIDDLTFGSSHNFWSSFQNNGWGFYKILPHRHLKMVFKSEGLAGLYRGVNLFLIHLTVRESIRYVLLRYCYTTLETICSSLDKFCGFFCRTFGLCTKDQISDDEVTLSEESNNRRCIMQPKYLAKYISEILSYPLLTCTSRLIVYEGFERLGIQDALELTYLYDGFKGFYQGFLPHFLVASANDIAEFLIHFIINSSSFPEEYSERVNLLLSAFPNALLLPLSQLSLVQRCQSSMEGLCRYEAPLVILRNFPWMIFSMTSIASILLLVAITN
ncbi:hypothetical protein IE077_003034 [Cardiosporidium cionae]|uniref:Uncharacterized protein n=1 Tax=Cardiosporidium cionae TaxID=476202 RepID=A0ABQ7J9C8_9APIC|nr:hypothetical protein IE077_003034 [Cardiosporidium cionae]|eukprot:KAF8820563.1 hypothetical protein IE077_003034 [Cardiosporidium cionae]